MDAGCRRLHLVDLNGAFAGEPVNGEVVTAIAAAYPDLPIQIGGGIRTLETIEHYVRAGVELCHYRHQGGEGAGFCGAGLCGVSRARSSWGWTPKTAWWPPMAGPRSPQVRATDLAKQFESDGVAAIVYTDIARDGMMQGVNVEATVAMAQASSIPVIASGGITNLEDITAPGGGGRPGHLRCDYRSRDL